MRTGDHSQGGEARPVVEPNRPDFGPRQVREREKLQVGMYVVVHDGPKATIRVKITSLYQSGNGSWWIRGISEHITSAPPFEHIVVERSLADCGVVPYTNRMWNPSNWLERVDEP